MVVICLIISVYCNCKVKISRYPDKFQWKSFMKDTVDAGTSRELMCVYLGSRSLDAFLQICAERCDHSANATSSSINQL